MSNYEKCNGCPYYFGEIDSCMFGEEDVPIDMEKKCPVCGAAMEEDMCSYCGYREKENIQESVYSQKIP